MSHSLYDMTAKRASPTKNHDPNRPAPAQAAGAGGLWQQPTAIIAAPTLCTRGIVAIPANVEPADRNPVALLGRRSLRQRISTRRPGANHRQR